MGKAILISKFTLNTMFVLTLASVSWGASLGMSTEAVDEYITKIVFKQDSIDMTARAQSIQRDEKSFIPTAYDKYIDYFRRAEVPAPCSLEPGYFFQLSTVHENNGFIGKEVITRKYILKISDGKNHLRLEMLGNYWATRVAASINKHSVSKFLMPVDVVINSATGLRADPSELPSQRKEGFALTWIVDEDYVIHSLRLQVIKPGETVSLKTQPSAILGDLINCHD